MHADERQFGPEGSGRWDFSGIHALFLNCTLKRSPELSHTEGLVRISREIMEKNGVSVEELRPVDYDIAPGVWPDMKEHEWEKDDWPDLWGGKTITDLRVHLGSYDSDSLEDFERRVRNVAKGVLSYGPVNLTDFEKRMKEGDEHSRRANDSSYQGFRNAVKREVERRDLVERGPSV